MEGYILKTGTRIAPFNDEVGETLVLDTTLENYQKQALREFCTEVRVINDLQEIRSPEFLLVEDHLFLTRFFLRKAMKAAGKGAGAVRFALAESCYLREKAVLDGLDLRLDDAQTAHAPLPLVLWRGTPFRAEELDRLPLVRVSISERPYIPEQIKTLREDLDLEYSITREGVLSVKHWSHITDINQIALVAYWADGSPKNVLWALGKVVAALSVNKWKILGKMNVIGRGCDIHPTAYVAASVLGDGVSIGPHCVVAGSFLGSRSKVESLTDVLGSVAGESAVISWRTKINFSVIYPYAIVSYPAAQMCVFGRHAMHMGGCFNMDTKLSQGDLLDVRVKHRGEIVNSGKKFLGICVGHHAIVGTGMWINSGVEVPNNYIIVRDKADIVSKIPAGFEKVTLSLQDGELQPYDRQKKPA
jgi:carbonic anhydrase/acetyltransferase-like protein (isoleucine patch superfamily)